MSPALRTARRAALALITLVILAVTTASFAESYRGLYLWASGHGLHGTWAAGWPLQLDAFIATGELALFVGLADRWRKRDRISAWAVTGFGLAASVAANVGHVTGHDLATRMTAAVPPLAAAASLAVGFGVLKKVVGAASQADTEPQPDAGHQVTAVQVANAGPESELSAGQVPELTAGPSAGTQSLSPRPRRTRQSRRTTKRQPAADREAAVLAIDAAEPGLSYAEIARRMGVDEASVRRYRKNLTPAIPNN